MRQQLRLLLYCLTELVELLLYNLNMSILVHLVNSRASIFYTTSVVVITTLIYFIWRRNFGRTLVNCWFCNCNTIVAYRWKNNWTCLHCQQYNGFTTSGDYNEQLPQMHDESMNAPTIARRANKNDSASVHIEQRVKLCSKCSRNQLLKIKQLSQFEPIVEENFEKEATEYRKKLDRLYALCPNCQEASERHIRMQDTIIRGSMLSVKQRLKASALAQKSPSATNDLCNKATKTVRTGVAVLTWFIVFGLSLLYTWYTASGIVYDLFSFSFYNVLNIFGKNYAKDMVGMVIVSGCTCSFVALSIKNVPKPKCAKLCAMLWLLCCVVTIMTPLSKPSYRGVKDYIHQIKRFYSFDSKDIDVSMKMDNKEATVDGELFNSVRSFVIGAIIRCVFCFFLMLTSFASFYCVKRRKQTQLTAKVSAEPVIKKLKKSRIVKETPEPAANLDVSMYSDCSMPSEDEIDAPEAKRHHNDKPADPGLNGSLNALNLQDGEDCSSSFTNFKQPSALFGGNMLPSTLHTPPPSRSSSLLSLSSHQSGPALSAPFSNNSMNKFGSTMDFARPGGDMPFQRYKTSTTIGGWTHHQTMPSNSAHRSVASYPAMKWQKSSHLLSNTMNSFGSFNNRPKKPLISPAKLQWRNKAQHRKRPLGSDWFQTGQTEDTTENCWEQKSDPDISVHDSVSQVGDHAVPELSDDHDIVSQTPKRNTACMDLNSSSPKSTISNLTSVTMRSIEEVERSRLCRWILVLCLLLNLVLVVLLVIEVKEMREAEQWKSRVVL